MIINTRADLNAVAGTPAYDKFMNTLRGSLFEVRKDDALQQWVADETNELIEQFGFVRSDFDPITPPVLPEYKPETIKAPYSVTKRQAKQQLLIAGLLSQVQPAIDAIEAATEQQMIQIYWDDSQEFERNHPQLIALATQALGLTDEQLDSLFIAASQL